MSFSPLEQFRHEFEVLKKQKALREGGLSNSGKNWLTFCYPKNINLKDETHLNVTALIQKCTDLIN